MTFSEMCSCLLLPVLQAIHSQRQVDGPVDDPADTFFGKLGILLGRLPKGGVSAGSSSLSSGLHVFSHPDARAFYPLCRGFPSLLQNGAKLQSLNAMSILHLAFNNERLNALLLRLSNDPASPCFVSGGASVVPNGAKLQSLPAMPIRPSNMSM